MNAHELSRRDFFGVGSMSMTGLALSGVDTEPLPPALTEAIAKIEPFFTNPADFRDISRGDPLPHTLTDARRSEVGLTRETWRLEVISDPEHPATLGKQFQKKDHTAIDFGTLLKMAETKAVRFAKIMTCLNIGCPLGMGIWEGVPLRDVVWLTQPRENLRRVFYYGYHNDQPDQMFRSSLSIGRVLEDPAGCPPVLLCYKLNDRWLNPQRGGPVRIIVPEAYGFKSVKWLTHVVLSNAAFANDTYAKRNNDIDSPLKTFAATLGVPEARVNKPIPITGYAQVGVSGLTKVQVWVSPSSKKWPTDDPYFTRAPWIDARILPPPTNWGGDITDADTLKKTWGFDSTTGLPKSWPMRLAKVHWAALLPALPAGEYTLRCRTIDANEAAQPMPRPFKKSGHCAIEEVQLTVNA